jgi:uncharacterized protein (DUF433 family)
MGFERIVAEQSVMARAPYIRGARRMPVATIVGMIAEGIGPDRIVIDYPQLSLDGIAEAPRFAAAAVDQGTLPLPT